jgi:prephenate dehydrogenase
MVVGVVGLGLMGGSFALALRETDQKELMILGSDHNTEHVKEAIDRGIIDASATLDEIKQSADVIILAVPVGAIKRLMGTMDGVKPNCTIIDLGSTKASIIQAATPAIRHHLVAAHPMAGTEYSGPKAAFSTLYRGKIAVLCNLEASGVHQQETAKKLFEAIGMKIVCMDAKEHDRHAAFISHMPHVISYAIANSVLVQEDKRSILTLAAGGFRDMSRLAKSPSSMWRDIFMENQQTLLASMDAFEKELARARELIAAGEWDALQNWMKNANTLHELFDPL